MMMNYADNLEDIVAEKTGQLIEAKRETEELLYKILPRYCFAFIFCLCNGLKFMVIIKFMKFRLLTLRLKDQCYVVNAIASSFFFVR